MHWVLSTSRVAMVVAMVQEPRQSQTFGPKSVTVPFSYTVARLSTFATEVNYEQHTTFVPRKRDVNLSNAPPTVARFGASHTSHTCHTCHTCMTCHTWYLVSPNGKNLTCSSSRSISSIWWRMSDISFSRGSIWRFSSLIL